MTRLSKSIFILITVILACQMYIPAATADHFVVVYDDPTPFPADIMDIGGTLTFNYETRAGDEIGVFFNTQLCGAKLISSENGTYTMHIANHNVINGGPQMEDILQIKLWDSQGGVEITDNIQVDILDPEVKDAQGNLIWKTGGIYNVNISYVLPVVVEQVFPGQGYSDIPTPITIRGNNFSEGIRVKLDQIELSDSNFDDETTITATVPTGLAVRVYDVTVIRGEVSGTLPDGFEVLPSVQPNIIGIAPNQGENDGVTTIYVIGGNFLSGAQLKITSQATGDVFLENLDYISSTTIVADVPAGLPVGSYDFTITNPGASPVTEPNGFTVLQGQGIEVSLLPGMNYLACPTLISPPYSSYDFFSEYFTPQSADSLWRYDNQNNQWEITVWDIQGQPEGDTFQITNGRGYILYANEETDLVFANINPSFETDLYAGMNLVSFNPPTPSYTSYNLFQALLNDQAKIIALQKYEKESGRWQITFNLFGKPAGDSFIIKKEESYVVHMEEERLSWMP